VKLLVVEEGSEAVATLFDAADNVTAGRISHIEARAAIAAAHRARRLSRLGVSRARQALADRWLEIAVIELDPALADAAGDAAERYALRSHDAIHLASATAVLDRELVVATWDSDLRRAVVEAGLAVAP
jgi:uncharacterized protein